MESAASKGACSQFDLQPLEGSKSSVWNYFGFPSRQGEFLLSVVTLLSIVNSFVKAG